LFRHSRNIGQRRNPSCREKISGDGKAQSRHSEQQIEGELIFARRGSMSHVGRHCESGGGVTGTAPYLFYHRQFMVQ